MNTTTTTTDNDDKEAKAPPKTEKELLDAAISKLIGDDLAKNRAARLEREKKEAQLNQYEISSASSYSGDVDDLVANVQRLEISQHEIEAATKHDEEEDAQRKARKDAMASMTAKEKKAYKKKLHRATKKAHAVLTTFDEHLKDVDDSKGKGARIDTMGAIDQAETERRIKELTLTFADPRIKVIEPDVVRTEAKFHYAIASIMANGVNVAAMKEERNMTSTQQRDD